MPITITVEDGSIVPDANSYQDVAGATTYALDRGVVLSATADVVAAQLLNAMDYLALYLDRWKGTIVDEAQSLPFPRDGIDYIGPNGAVLYVDNDVIPTQLVAAQSQLVMAIHSGIVSLLPNADAGLPVIMEKVGPLETRYATPQQAGSFDWTTVNLPIVETLLAPLLKAGFGLRTRRV